MSSESTMSVRDLGPGLWRWTSPHPAWKDMTDGWPRDVGSVYWEAPEGGAILLVDPIVPAVGSEERERFFRELDRDVERVSGELAVLVLNLWHGRSAADFRERYDAQVFASAATASAISCPVDTVVTGALELPGGAQAIVVGGLSPSETVAHLPGSRALVFGDVVLGSAREEEGAEPLRLGPDVFPAQDPAARARLRAEVVASLRSLLALDFDMALPSHGEPMLSGAKEALRRCLS